MEKLTNGTLVTLPQWSSLGGFDQIDWQQNTVQRDMTEHVHDVLISRPLVITIHFRGGGGGGGLQII